LNKIKEFTREIQLALHNLAETFPIVCITGPRQSGKTTLTQQHFPNKPYFNLEDPSQRMQIMNDPKGLITSLGRDGAIFDETQHFPDLLSYLQVESDLQKIKGQFILTSSYNLALMESVSQWH
jgi:uncharacterized protein